MRTHSRQFGPVYGNPPCSEIQGRIAVGVHLSAGCTPEHILAADSTLPATRARLGAIGWVHKLNADASALSLVADEALQLAERPTRHHAVQVLVPDLGALPNATELFHADHSALVPLRFEDDLFGQDMVLMPDTAMFVSGKTSEHAPRTPSVLALETGANSHALSLELASLGPVMQRAEGRGGCVADPEIDTHRPATAHGIGVGIFHHDMDVESPFAAHDHGCSRTLSGEGLTLIVPKHQRNVDAPTEHGERDALILLAQGEDAGVVVDAGRAEFAGLLTAPLGRRHRGGYPANGPHREIGGKPEIGPECAVAGVVELDVIGDALPHRASERQIAGTRERLAGGSEMFRHHGRGGHPATDRALAHSEHYITKFSAPPPLIEIRGFRREEFL